MNHFESVVSFSEPILKNWLSNQSDIYNAEIVQQQYLYSMAKGSMRSSSSFYTLIEQDKHHDLPVLARLSLERYMKADFARRSPTNAVALMIHEVKTVIIKLNKLAKLPSSDSAMLILKVSDLEKDLQKFEGLVDPDYPKDLSMFRIFELCELEEIYRGAYHELSKVAHGGFHSGFKDVRADGLLNFLALMTPVDATNMLYMTYHETPAYGYESLRESIYDRCFQK
ncbi:DUF5677 domain-containing protein [Luteolibacter algae]|uniref:DUF5677 domain-containing protein n=1 Tax=Luteolibacter algae TaxID=454151 RepID=A0ABW5D3J7_9BACT